MTPKVTAVLCAISFILGSMLFYDIGSREVWGRGVIYGKWYATKNMRIRNSYQRIPYDMFLREGKKTGPITGIWIEDNILKISTDKDGIVDLRPLEMEGIPL